MRSVTDSGEWPEIKFTDNRVNHVGQLLVDRYPLTLLLAVWMRQLMALRNQASIPFQWSMAVIVNSGVSEKFS